MAGRSGGMTTIRTTIILAVAAIAVLAVPSLAQEKAAALRSAAGCAGRQLKTRCAGSAIPAC
jgi:hypothetical protein